MTPMTLQRLFSAVGLSLSPRVRRYAGSFAKEELGAGEFGAGTLGTEDTQGPTTFSSTIKADETRWRAGIDLAKALPRTGTHATFVDVHARYGLMSGVEESAGTALVFRFAKWSSDNYVLIPGAVYNGNRFRCLPMPYPPLLTDPTEHRLNAPVTITDIPRLERSAPRSEILQTTGDASVPAMGFYSPSTRHAALLLTGQRSRFGNSGLFISEDLERERADFSIVAPCVRRWRQGVCRRETSSDHGVPWAAGDEAVVHARLYVFPAESVQDLFHVLAVVHRDLTGPPVMDHTFPFEAAYALAEDKYNQQNWLPELGLYTVEVDHASTPSLWQLGWVGGCMVTHAFLARGSEESRHRSWANLNVVLNESQTSSGLLYGAGDDTNWYSDAFSEPHPRNMLLIRKNADALYFFMKQLLLLSRPESSARPPQSWTAAVKRLANAFAHLWDHYGQFGQFVNVATADILVGGTCSAAIAPAGLALAAGFYGEDRFLSIAVAAAEYYYREYTAKGLHNGGPGEVLSAPDSESAFSLLESFIVLFEVTGNRAWLARAEAAAEQAMSWCVAYDYSFPVGSLFGRLDLRTCGAVYANVQNKHAAPGICTLSGDSLLRLYRATQREAYLDQLRETAHNLMQYFSRRDRPIGNLPPGWMNERVNMGDWEGADMVGNVFYGSCWPEVSALLTCVEVPGVYVRPDLGSLWGIDHVDVSMESASETQLHLRLSNPTPFPAAPTFLIETAEDCGRPLGVCGMLERPSVVVPPGVEGRVRVYHAHNRWQMSSPDLVLRSSWAQRQ